MIEPYADRPGTTTLGADKGYDAEDFVNELRSMQVRPHVAQNTSGRRSAVGSVDVVVGPPGREGCPAVRERGDWSAPLGVDGVSLRN